MKCYVENITSSLHKHKVDGGDEAAEGGEMVPVQALALEEDVGDDGEDDERHALLYHFELHEGEGAAVGLEPDAVGRHLTTIFEEGDGPTEGDDPDQRPVAADAGLLQFEMTVPCDGHEDVAQDEQQYGVQSVHFSLLGVLQIQ